MLPVLSLGTTAAPQLTPGLPQGFRVYPRQSLLCPRYLEWGSPWFPQLPARKHAASVA